MEFVNKWLELHKKANFPAETVPMTADEMRQFLRKTDQEHRSQLENIISVFAKAGTWPRNLTTGETYFLAKRLNHAAGILGLVSARVDSRFVRRSEAVAAVSEPPPPRDVLATWLLIDAWKSSGREQWIDEFLLAETR